MNLLFKKSLFILGAQRRQLVPILLLFIMSSLVDLLSIGMVAPFIAIIIDPELFTGTWLGALDVPWLNLADHSWFILVLGMILGGLFFLKLIIGVFVQYQITRFAERITTEIRSTLARGYLTSNYLDIITRRRAELVSNVTSAAEDFGSGIVMSVLRGICDVMIALVLFVFLAVTDPVALTFLLITLFGFLIFYDSFVKKKLAFLTDTNRQARIRIIKTVSEGVDGLREISLLNLHSVFQNEVASNSKIIGSTKEKLTVYNTIPRNLIELLLVVYIVLLVYWAILIQRDITELLPTLGVFGVAAVRLMPLTKSLAATFAVIRETTPIIDVIYKDLRAFRETKGTDLEVAELPFQSLELKDVSFRYPKGVDNVLNNLSFRLDRGQTVGIMGESGAGKSTFIDVLASFINPDQGSVLLNGVPVERQLGTWRGMLGYLPQDIFLLNDSLELNIALRDDLVDRKRLGECLSLVGLDNLLSSLPEGADTLIGDRGVQLSGGQRQRLVLARALYHRRQVLVFDEATSSLDIENERNIMTQMQSLDGSVSMIIVAHRKSTLRYCDVIYEMVDGALTQIE